jgi:hypothetical protein
MKTSSKKNVLLMNIHHDAMLDINNPRTQLIFQASAYMSKVKSGCQKYILESYEERQATFAKMITACEQLLIHSETSFPDQLEEIRSLVAEIVAEIHALSVIDRVTEAGNCTVCNGPIKRGKTLVPEFPEIIWCGGGCPKKIMDCLSKLEVPTEVWWI